MKLKIIAILCFLTATALAASAQQPATTLFCGSIGVKVGPMTAAFADSLGMTERYGAIFQRPQPGGPAAKAGIEARDVVTAINGAQLTSWRDFATAISATAPGTVVQLTTYRNHELIDVRVRVAWSRCANR